MDRAGPHPASAGTTWRSPRRSLHRLPPALPPAAARLARPAGLRRLSLLGSAATRAGCGALAPEKIPATPIPSPRIAEVASHWLPVAVTPAASSSASPASTALSRPRRSPASRSSSRWPSAHPSTPAPPTSPTSSAAPSSTAASPSAPLPPSGPREPQRRAPPRRRRTAPRPRHPLRRRALVPFARAFLVEFDPAAKSIRMALPEGLAEINLQPNRAAPEK